MLIKGILDDAVGNVNSGIDDLVGDEEDIPLPNIAIETMRVVESFCDYCRSVQGQPPFFISKPIKSTNFAEVCNEIVASILDVDQDTLFRVMLAAHYLEIDTLLDACCAKVACQIKGRPVKEIRRFFGVENDFSLAEEKQIVDENEWAKDCF